uniref:hypothetical protein n=1 Tax=Hypnea wynnei TaxID=1867777 RepID=UPI0027DAA77E|nr:hypothetical protein REP92_pgp122 [Hypnea wynnei]WCH56505.1 hypothetical protein [Hypnea wynnei]
MKRTANNIWIKYKFFTTNIYYIFKKTNQILIIFFFIFSIFLYKSKIQKSINYNQQLAFQAYIIHYKNKIQINNSKIENQKLFLKILPNYYNKINQYKSKIHVKKILEYLKNIGTINQLNYFIININNLKYYIIKVHINNIIKKIEIQNYKYLQIPQKLLIHILKPQLGAPIDYSKIHHIINRIYAWYINNGFSHTYIKLKYKKQSQNLYVQIFEGQIIANYLICKSNNILSSTIINKINKILIKELGVSKKSIFNKKKIDRGIIYLKKIQLLKTCHYKVQKYKQGLVLQIEYSIITNHYGYIYNYDSNINKLLLYKILNNDYVLSIPINFHTLPRILQKFIQQISQIHKSHVIYLKYKSNLKKIFNFKYLRFNYYLNYINSNYKINLQTINNIPEFEFLILIPYIKLNKIIFNFIKLNIYQKIYKNKKIYPQQNKITNDIVIKNKIMHSINIKSRGNFIIINQNIFKNFKYKFKYINVHNLFTEKFLYFKTYYLNTSLIKKLKIQRYKKLVQQKIILINTEIKYSNLKYRKFLESGKVVTFEFLFLKPQKIIKKNILNKDKFSKNNIKLKYYQIILLPKYLKFIKKNAINIFINMNSFIIYNNYTNMLNDINHINFQIYFQKRYTRMIKYNAKCLYQIEYHISLSKFCSYYVFSNINNKVYYKNKIFKYNYSLGSGIQMDIPIKKLPKIRFEYKINQYDINHYQLRLF